MSRRLAVHGLRVRLGELSGNVLLSRPVSQME